MIGVRISVLTVHLELSTAHPLIHAKHAHQAALHAHTIQPLIHPTVTHANLDLFMTQLIFNASQAATQQPIITGIKTNALTAQLGNS